MGKKDVLKQAPSQKLIWGVSGDIAEELELTHRLHPLCKGMEKQRPFVNLKEKKNLGQEGHPGG